MFVFIDVHYDPNIQIPSTLHSKIVTTKNPLLITSISTYSLSLAQDRSTKVAKFNYAGESIPSQTISNPIIKTSGV